MGAASWLSDGVSRAMSGARSALPGQAEEGQPQDPATVRSVHTAPAADVRTSAAEGAAPAEAAPAQTAPAKAANPAPAAEPTAPAPSRAATVGKAPTKEAPARKPAAAKKPAKATASGSAARRTAKPPAASRRPSAAAQHTADDERAGEGGHARAAKAAWSDQELTEFRAALNADIMRLREELNMGEADLAEMLAHNDPAGDDQADAGAQTLEREQEMSVAANARELLDQSVHALYRLDAGTYGVCESCGNLILGARLRAFPRATLCIACKQAEERG